jgi:hypothetical protein
MDAATAFGSGYAVFSCVGRFAVVLTFVVAARTAKREPAAKALYEALS